MGRQVCAGCHAREQDLWRGSQHDRALQVSSKETARGDFHSARFTHSGEHFEFTLQGDTPTVQVSAQGQAPRTFPVRYTFGVEPLQQYLIDIGGGHLQALAVAWDTRQSAQGGQRWFHLQDKELVPPGDPLHWQGPQYNWNSMCADCHSTGVVRGYDATAQTYATTFAEEDVSCESCHGPGSGHVAWAEQHAKGQPSSSGDNLGLAQALPHSQARRWVLREGARIASLEGSSPSDAELETCAPCHSRRSDLGPGAGSTFYDRYRLSLLSERLYFADGQIKDEVFEIGSFLQSTMHARGVTCSDCHEPHTQKLRRAGNDLCSSCHRAESYDTPQHHFHAAGTQGALCTSCHMPVTTYMVVDPRRDHALKIPRPGVSERTGAPDPCTSCHVGKTQKWAQAEISQRYPRHAEGGTAALALWLARTGQPGAQPALRAVVQDGNKPAILRASALEELADFPGPALQALAVASAQSPEPLLRRTAAGAARSLPDTEGLQVVLRLLQDPVRSVRQEAAETLMEFPPDMVWSVPGANEAVTHGLAEYEASLRFSADRAESLTDLAALARWNNQSEEAQKLLQVALQRDPTFSPAHLNLADLYRARGDDEGALRVLDAGLKRAADSAVLQHSRGLTLVRLGRQAEGLAALRVAFEASPERPRFGYVYAVALFDLGNKPDAIRVLEGIAKNRPGDVPTLQALIAYLQQMGETTRAEAYAHQLQAAVREDG